MHIEKSYRRSQPFAAGSKRTGKRGRAKEDGGRTTKTVLNNNVRDEDACEQLEPEEQ